MTSKGFTPGRLAWVGPDLDFPEVTDQWRFLGDVPGRFGGSGPRQVRTGTLLLVLWEEHKKPATEQRAWAVLTQDGHLGWLYEDELLLFSQKEV